MAGGVSARDDQCHVAAIGGTPRTHRCRVSGSVLALVVARFDADAPAAGDEIDPAV